MYAIKLMQGVLKVLRNTKSNFIHYTVLLSILRPKNGYMKRYKTICQDLCTSTHFVVHGMKSFRKIPRRLSRIH